MLISIKKISWIATTMWGILWAIEKRHVIEHSFYSIFFIFFIRLNYPCGGKKKKKKMVRTSPSPKHTQISREPRNTKVEKFTKK